MRNIWAKLRWSLEYRGVKRTARMLVKQAARRPDPWDDRASHPFDLEHGVETSGIVPPEDLATGHSHDAQSHAYVGIAPSRFQSTIRRWLETPPVVPAEHYAFVDLGCGKGRAVLLAAELHFRETIGVELNPALARVAENNLEIWRRAGRAPRPARMVCGDATEFVLPEGPCVVYLANPFGAVVLDRLLERLEARRAAGGGTVDILYQTPQHEPVFERRPRFRRLWSGVMPVSKADAAAERSYGTTDRCIAYRI